MLDFWKCLFCFYWESSSQWGRRESWPKSKLTVYNARDSVSCDFISPGSVHKLCNTPSSNLCVVSDRKTESFGKYH
jgi:hypothetical protein